MSQLTLDVTERRLLRLICEDFESREIAKRLSTSTLAVRSAIGALQLKLGISRRADIARRAAELGLIAGDRAKATAPPLTDVQRRVLRRIAEHYAPKDIAANLGKSLGAVYQILRILRRHYAVPTNLDAVDAAIDAGMLDGPKPTKMPNPISEADAAILNLRMRGMSYAEVADQLGLTRGAIGSRLTELAASLGLGTGRRDKVVVEAVRLGYITKHGIRPALVSRSVARERGAPKSPAALTRRMTEILQLLAENQHLTAAEMASSIGITRSSFLTYASQMRRLLGVRSYEDILDAARRLGVRVRPAEKRSFGERDVLKCLNAGLEDRAIAKKLGVGLTDVRAAIRHLHAKYTSRTRRELIIRAHELGMIPSLAAGVISKPLTPQQQRILELKAQHLSQRHIAQRLGIPLLSVRFTLADMRKQWAVKTTLELIDATISAGVLKRPGVTTAPNIFTARETQVLQGKLLGLSSREIAHDMGIKHTTIGPMLYQMRGKVRAGSNEELLEEAERLGFVRRHTDHERMIPRSLLKARKTLRDRYDLTPRTREIMRELERHPQASRDELAALLNISKSTLDGHLDRLRQYLGVSSYKDIAARAREIGL